jgi:hypothetical protein
VKIAMLGPVAWRTPPRHYGPWEQVTSLLTEGLVRRGVNVTLFATADSVTSARLEAVVPAGYAEHPEMDGRVWEALHVGRALERSGEFDLVHNHLDWLPLAFARSWGAPMVTTIHGFSGAGILPVYRQAGSAFVSISDADRSTELDSSRRSITEWRCPIGMPLPRRAITSSRSAASTPTRARRMPSRSPAARADA